MSVSFISPNTRTGAPLCLLIAVVVLFGATSCGRSDAKSDTRAEEGAAKGGAGNVPEAAPVAVTTAKAEAREVPSYIQSTGSLVAEETSDVASQASGQVVATPVGVGAFVRQGDVIARLNDRDARLRLQQAQAGVQQAIAGVRQAEARLGLRPGGNFDASVIPEARAATANLEQAQAELRLAEANERRYRALVETGDTAVSTYDQFRTQRDTARSRVNAARQQLESALNTARQSNQAIQTAESAVSSARAQVAIAQKAVADAVIRAPYAGYISNRPIAVGEYVTPAAVIATVLRTNPIKLQLQVPEAEAPFITPGMGISL
ncbi:MAG TPA: HlyD family efflux transporter periplasmic adaptor subunit, partial [Pyrinomonadaceae bacterium]